MADSYDKIIASESAEIAQMKKKIALLEERQAVTGVLTPHKRGGSKIVVHDTTNDRYVIRIPKALQRDGQVKITATSEQEAYHKAYLLLCTPHEEPAPAPTMRDIYSMVLEERSRDRCLADETVKRDERFWRRWYDHATIVDQPVADLKVSDLLSFLRNSCGSCEVTRNTYTNIKSLMNLIYDYAVAHDIIAINTARQIGRTGIRFKPQGTDTYTDDERSRILAYIEQGQLWDRSPYYAAIYLAFHLCVRVGELKALRWTDYDPAARKIRIEREVVTRDGRQVELDHTKSSEHGSRPQHVPAKAANMLAHLMQNRTSLLILPTQTGQYLDTDKLNNKLKVICRHVGIPYKSSHKIRFWSVTALVKATDGDIETVGRYAGQYNRQTTEGYIRDVKRHDTQWAAAREAYGV